MNQSKSNQQRTRNSLNKLSKIESLNNDILSFEAEYKQAHGKEAIEDIIKILQKKYKKQRR